MVEENSQDRAGEEPGNGESAQSHSLTDSVPAAASSGHDHRGEPFTVPAETTFLFVLLVAAVSLSSLVFFFGVWSQSPGAQEWVQVWGQCVNAHLSVPSTGGIDDFTSLRDWSIALDGNVAALQQCVAPVQWQKTLWALGGLALVLGVGLVLYLAHPLWYVRRYRLRDFDPADGATLLAELDRLRQLAGVGPVRFLCQPFNPVPSAFVFGPPRRRRLVVSAGLAVRHHTNLSAFRATVLHELAHLRNRDVDPAHLAVALTAAVGLVFGVFTVWFLLDTGVGSWLTNVVARAVLLGLLAVLLLAALVRSREFHADARAATWGADGAALSQVLTGMPAPPRRVLAGLRALHPSPVQRARALSGGAALFSLGFWGGLGAGLGATVAFVALTMQTSYLVPDSPPFWIGLGPAVLVAAVLVVGRWRLEVTFPGAAHRRVWPFSLGLATGVALGPLASLEQIAVDLDPLGLLVWLPAWTLLVVAMTAPVASWIAEGAAGWRALTARAESVTDERAAVPRWHRWAALLAAIGIAAAIYAVLLRIIVMVFVMFVPTQTTFFNLLAPTHAEGSLGVAEMVLLAPFLLFGAAVSSHAVPVLLFTLAALVVALALGLVRVRVRLRSRRLPHRPNLLPAELRGAVRTGLVAGGAALVLVLLAVLQVRLIPLQERWDNKFVIVFRYSLIGAIVVIGVLAGLIAARRAQRWPLTCGGLAALGCAAVGVLAMVGQPYLGTCVDVFALRPSTEGCLRPFTPDYDWLMVEAIVGTTGLVVGFLLPGYVAIHARTTSRNRPHRPQSPAPRRRQVVAALLAVVVLSLAGYAVVQASRSAELTGAGASIGDQGWIDGPGYRLRLPPGWFDVTNRDPGVTDDVRRLQLSGFAFRASLIISPTAEFPLDRAAAKTLQRDGHPTTVAGAPARIVDEPAGTSPDRTRYVVIERSDEQLVVVFTTRSGAWEDTLADLDDILVSWQWQDG